MTKSLSRRSFLIQGAAAGTSAALARSAFGAAKRVRVHNPKSLAGAAGQIWIGGDLQVNRVGFGTGELGGEKSWVGPSDAATRRAVLRRAVDLGVNFIDTADIYGPTVAEKLIYDALYPYPSDLVISSKGGQVRPGALTTGSLDGRPEHLREACEGSLKRLHLEQIPLYQMHWPDPNVPYEDSIGALAKLQQEGKIRHIGVCNVDAALLAKARSVATVVSVENRYNVISRQSDDIIALCEREHIAFIPWFPLARRGQGNAAAEARLAALQALATERHIEMPEAALAWLLARSPVMLPIPGTVRVDHLEENLAATKVRFTKQEMAQIG
jgi:pyridoxine 4-dehydrogenase